jgi:hypothetical protein
MHEPLPDFCLFGIPNGDLYPGSTFILVAGVYPESYAAAVEAIAVVLEFEREEEKLQIAKINCEEAEAYISYLKEPHEFRSREEIHTEAVELARKYVNALSGIRLYLDHTETRLNRRYGEDSKIFSDFTAACSHEFDNVFEYRFIYKLRDYVQHCGMPFQHIVDRHISEQDSRRTCEIGFKPKELLDDYKKWGTVRTELENHSGEIIEAQGVLTKVFQSIQRIHLANELSERPSLLEHGRKIINVVKPAFDLNMEPMLTKTPPLENEIRSSEFHQVPFEGLLKLGLIKWNPRVPRQDQSSQR